MTKIFDRILRKSMIEYFESNELMKPTHQGFRYKRSTISKILHFYEDIISKLENRDDVYAWTQCRCHRPGFLQRDWTSLFLIHYCSYH